MRFPLKRRLRRIVSRELGAAVAEYAVLIALVAVLVVLAVPSVGVKVSEKVSRIAVWF